MRRLPVFFVVDVSESMVGEPLELLEDGIEQIISVLRQDPYSLETVYVSVIAFAGKAEAITPLVDLISFYPPKLPLGGGTSLGKALDTLMEEIDVKIKKTTLDERGDWEPVVFLITDGKATDDYSKSVQRWKNEYSNNSTFITITLGTSADMNVLGDLSNAVLALENTDKNEFFKFIEWVSASVKAQSQKIEVENKTGTISLEKTDQAGLTLIEDTKTFNITDPDCVTLIGRCSENMKPYVIKYKHGAIGNVDRFIKNKHYILEGAYPLDNSYFDWSSTSYQPESIDTSFLDGVPPCPQCGNSSAFAMCGCGKLLCVGEELSASCPWCEKQITFSTDGEGGDFSINKGQG